MTGSSPARAEHANDLSVDGAVIAAAHLDVVASKDSAPWQTAEVIQRLQASDTTAGTLESLHATVADLCCQYPYKDPNDLAASTSSERLAGATCEPCSTAGHADCSMPQAASTANATAAWALSAPRPGSCG